MTDKTPIEVLEGAREIIADGKWGKYRFFDHKTECFCILGAIRITIEPVSKYGMCTLSKAENWALADLTQDYLAQHIPEVALGGTFTALHAWNDHPERTQEDVLELIDKTIEQLKLTSTSES